MKWNIAVAYHSEPGVWTAEAKTTGKAYGATHATPRHVLNNTLRMIAEHDKNATLVVTISATALAGITKP